MENKQMTIASIIKKFDQVNNSQFKPNGQALFRFLLNKGLTPRTMYFNGTPVETFDGKNAINMMTRFFQELKEIDDEIKGRVSAKKEAEMVKKEVSKNNKPVQLTLFNENKKTITLRESELYKMIKESVCNILKKLNI